MPKKNSASLRSHVKHFAKSVWLFPALVLTGLVILTSLQISGSSVGIYTMLYGPPSTKDTHMLGGNMRGVRSDEWLVMTQMVVAQANNGFKRVNDNIGNGQDMSLVLDVPYLEWSAVFKPQNFIFFILPLEYAFAFKWWLLAVILMLSCYFLMLELFPKKLLRSTLIAIFVGLSPMLVWWYQSATLLPVAYGFLIILFGIRLLNAKTRKTKVAYSLTLTYVLICFALILYPPFQIPCLIAAAVFILGWILDNLPAKKRLKHVVSFWPYMLLIFALVLSTIVIFYFGRQSAIQTTGSTVYPGTRIITSGGLDPLLITSSFLSPNLQYDSKAASGYLGNQSEASSFIFVAPFILLPSMYILYRAKRQPHKTFWGLLLINGLLLFFLARMYLPFELMQPIYRLFVLDKVPNTRLLIGLGFSGILQLALIIKALGEATLSKKELWLISLTGALTGLAVMLGVGIYTVNRFPVFISSYPKVFLFAFLVAFSIFLILRRKYELGLVLLVGFSLIAVYKVQPLYRGLDPLTESPAINVIKAYPEDGNWVVLDDRLLINFPVIAGKPSLNSVNFYPQLQLWRELDKSSQYNFEYNRFAHVVFISDPRMTKPFSLPHADTLYVKFTPCNAFFQDNSKYILSDKKLDSTCVALDQAIDLPQKDLYVYKILKH